MKYYQIVETSIEQHHAGSKATADITSILEKEKFEQIVITKYNEENTMFSKIKRQLIYFRDYKKAYKCIEDNSIVVLQHPFHNKQLTRYSTLKRLKNNKNVKFISIVHDVEELRRMLFNKYYANEFSEMLELSNWLIVHNEQMKEFIVSKGYDSNKIIVLNIFDYLVANEQMVESFFSKSITIAGNLDNNKSPYIQELSNLQNLMFDLYGPNFNGNDSDISNIIYHGAFSADELPNKLNKGFGLVWDGDSIYSCTENTGNYLKYNSPHKLSLYLASGLPVIVWNKAACSDFVRRYGVGIVVSSLTELGELLDDFSQEEYTELICRVNKVALQLRTGYFIKTAVSQITTILE